MFIEILLADLTWHLKINISKSSQKFPFSFQKDS